jgi:hypothetical protein
MSLPNGAFGAPASITMSRSRSTTTRVPFRFAREQVEARITARTVEVFPRGERIAAHIRSSGNGGHTTLPDHMPSSIAAMADWTIDRIRKEASLVGADDWPFVRDSSSSGPSRTGLSRLHRHPATGQGVRRAAGSAAEPSDRDRNAVLRLGPLDPRQASRPNREETRAGIGCRTRSFTLTSAAPAITTKEKKIMLSHPTLEQLHQHRPCRHGRGLRRDLAANARPNRFTCRMARSADRPGMVTPSTRQALAARLRYAKLRHQAVAEDVDYQASRGVSTGPSSRSSAAAPSSLPMTI